MASSKAPDAWALPGTCWDDRVQLFKFLLARCAERAVRACRQRLGRMRRDPQVDQRKELSVLRDRYVIRTRRTTKRPSSPLW